LKEIGGGTKREDGRMRRTRPDPLKIMLLMASLATGLCFADGEIHRFTQIPRNHTIYVKYFQQGCFGYCGYHFEFRFDPAPCVRIIKRDPVFSKRRGRWLDKKAQAPERIIDLSDADLKALDVLLELYRAASRPIGDELSIMQFSTLSEEVEFSERSGSRVIAREKFENQTGNTNPDPRPEGFVSFPDLICRAASR